MTAFIRRFRELPTLEQLTEIEQIAIVDGTPSTPVTGLGSGALMLVGEFEDGPFNTPTEVFGGSDELRQFGGFGYTYGDTKYQNPCARTHLGETWNGNGFLKGKFLRPPRKIIVRVDTSVGEALLAPTAARFTDEGPFRLEVGDQLSIAYNGGGAGSTTAVAAAAALAAGSGFAGTSGYGGGEQIGITIDGNAETVVSFAAADSTPAQVAAKINTFLGYTGAVVNAGEVDISALVEGTSGSITLRDITAGALAAIGHTAGTTAGTGNVADLSAVTATELAALGFGGAGGAVAVVGSRVAYRTTTLVTGTVNVASGGMQGRLGLTTGVSLPSNQGEAVRVPAGTRVRASAISGSEWVVMTSTDWPEGTAAAPNDVGITAKIRPALDNGTAVGATPGQVNTLVDQPGAGRFWVVTNTTNVSAALTENEIDVAYEAAFDKTLDITRVTRSATVSLSARRSDAVVRKGRTNAIDASNEGNRGRVFHARERLGVLPAVAISNVASFRSDRVNYCYPGWEVRIPEIAEVGVAGGTGFTADGVITIGSDGPLAYINAVLPPEENPGQDTELLADFVLGIEPIEQEFNRELYTAFKRAGICAPRVDQRGVPVYQSEVTTDLTAGRTTQKRRKMADYIQDSLAVLLLPFSKKLATDAREAGIDAMFDSFLGTLKDEDGTAGRQRIRDYSVANTTRNNPQLADRGISARKTRVKLLASLDTFVVDTEIGEGVVVVNDADG